MGRTDTASTPGACMWKDMFRREVKPAPQSQINFSKPKRTASQLKHIPEKSGKLNVKGMISVLSSSISVIFVINENV